MKDTTVMQEDVTVIEKRLYLGKTRSDPKYLLDSLGPVRQLWFQIGACKISAPKFEMVRFQVAARSKFGPLFGSHSKLCTA